MRALLLIPLLLIGGPKHGPPLTRATHKAHRAWIWAKIRSPKHHPSARMPEPDLTDQDARDILACLDTVAGLPYPPVEPGDAELGRDVWTRSRCVVCHVVNGSDGAIDLGTGGRDLFFAGRRLRREWLYAWIRDPRSYFPDTRMPRYRFSDAEVRALVEYILTDDAFRPANEPLPDDPIEDGNPSRGKRLIEISRCVVCHDIEGIREILPRRPRPQMEILPDVQCLTCHSNGAAPDLANAGSRLRPEWVREFLQRPDHVRPLSPPMPDFHLSATEAELVVECLATDADIPDGIPGGAITEDEIARGRDAFRARGCMSCHSTGDGPGGAVGPSLTRVADRLRPGYLWYHLKHPHAVNPRSAEPDYGLTDEEARILAAYLSTKRSR